MILEYYWSKFMKLLRARGIARSRIDKTSTIYPGSSVVESSVGRHSYCGCDCCILSADIGSFCSISDEVFIEGYSGHFTDYVSTSPVFFSHKSVLRKKFSHLDSPKPARAHIGNDVWIGKRALIKAGVNIGTGAVIGMGSVVTKNVEPYSIVAGNPARPIRNRFNQEMIAALLASKWWDLPDSALTQLSPQFNDPDAFLEAVKSYNSQEKERDVEYTPNS